MRISSLLASLAVVSLVSAHGADVLEGRALHDHWRRQAGLRSCSSALQARHPARMHRVKARRDQILADSLRKRCEEPEPPHHHHHNMTASTSASKSTSTSKSLSTSKSTTSKATSTSTSMVTSMSMVNGSGSGMPSGTGGMPNGTMGGGNMTMTGGGGGGGAGGGGGVTYTPTATAHAAYNTSINFPSATASAAPASATTQASDGACALSPEQEEGPYYIQGEQIRSNLVEDQTGVPFFMEFNVIDTNTCEPLVGAALDIWSCNATGVYGGFTGVSGVSTSVWNGELAQVGDSNDIGSVIEDGNTFLRGMQLTDTNGSALFTGIIPGWYSGRAPHIHVRVHYGGSVTTNGTYIGGNLTHTGQTFFGEDFYSQIQNTYPYTNDHVNRTLNSDDRPWTQENGSYAAWNLFYVVEADVSQGMIGVLNLAVDSSATDQMGV